jgi:hypothetical protein
LSARPPCFDTPLFLSRNPVLLSLHSWTMFLLSNLGLLGHAAALAIGEIADRLALRAACNQNNCLRAFEHSTVTTSPLAKLSLSSATPNFLLLHFNRAHLNLQPGSPLQFVLTSVLCNRVALPWTTTATTGCRILAR